MKVNSASRVLKEGLIISTKLGTSHIWHPNIVYMSWESTVALALTEDYLKNGIMAGASITIKYFSEHFEYIFQGSIQSIHPDYPGYILVLLEFADEKINSRTHPRFDTYIAANIRHAWDETPYFSIITNISYTGLAFTSKYRFDLGEVIEIRLSLSDDREVALSGKVTRKSVKVGSLDYGVLFDNLSVKQEEIFSGYLDSLEEEKNLLQNYFNENIKNLLKIRTI